MESFSLEIRKAFTYFSRFKESINSIIYYIVKVFFLDWC